jgi:hypothetical protein
MTQTDSVQFGIGSMLCEVDKTLLSLTNATKTLNDDILQYETVITNGKMEVSYDKDGIAKVIRFHITVDLEERRSE